MPQLKYTDMLKAVSADEWKKIILSVSSRVGLKTTNWGEGGFTRTLLAILAELYATHGAVVQTIAAALYLDSAAGFWLTLLAKNVFNVDRIEATYASAVEGLTLTNTGPKLFVFDPGDIIVAHASSNKTYRNTTGGTLSPGIGQTLKLDLVAEEPGSDSNAPPGTITKLVSTFLGFTVTNGVTLSGLDEEQDPELRQRCRDSVAARSIGGIKRAYVFFAKSARRANGTAVGVTRVLVPPADGTGIGLIYIAGAGGAISGPDVAVVQSEFDTKVTHYGFTAIATSATNKNITAPCTVWVPLDLGLDAATIKQKVLDALSAYIKTRPIGGEVISGGGKVFWEGLQTVAGSAVAGTIKAHLTSQVDIAIASNEVPVWAGVLADTTVNLV